MVILRKVYCFNELGRGEVCPMAKNPCGKTRKVGNPYEVWESSDGWTWKVLKKYSTDDAAPHAWWFCFVTSPMCPDGEYGDVYVCDIYFSTENHTAGRRTFVDRGPSDASVIRRVAVAARRGD